MRLPKISDTNKSIIKPEINVAASNDIRLPNLSSNTPSSVYSSNVRLSKKKYSNNLNNRYKYDPSSIYNSSKHLKLSKDKNAKRLKMYNSISTKAQTKSKSSEKSQEKAKVPASYLKSNEE